MRNSGVVSLGNLNYPTIDRELSCARGWLWRPCVVQWTHVSQETQQARPQLV